MPNRVGYSQVAEVTGGKLNPNIAGQVPHDTNDKLVGEGDFEAQVEQVFKNVDAAVRAAGGTFKDVVKINNYCVAAVTNEQRAAFAKVRDRYVNTANPTGQHLHLRRPPGAARLAVRDGRHGGDQRLD